MNIFYMFCGEIRIRFWTAKSLGLLYYPSNQPTTTTHSSPTTHSSGGLSSDHILFFRFQFGALLAVILALKNLVCKIIENPQSQTSLQSNAKSSVVD